MGRELVTEYREKKVGKETLKGRRGKKSQNAEL